jgi:hypothetical protein
MSPRTQSSSETNFAYPKAATFDLFAPGKPWSRRWGILITFTFSTVNLSSHAATVVPVMA